MPFTSWDTAPESVRSQIKRFVRDSRAILGENLAGIYLHGSLAMGCFNPERSDVDMLVVTRRPMSPEVKRLTAGLMLAQSGAPQALEVSWVLEPDLKHWRHPFPYDFHYSEAWRSRVESNLNRLDWEMWGGAEKTDVDLAAHFTILLKRGGVVLYGPPVQQLFAPVPTSDYIDSLLYDLEGARDHILEDPVYGVLNLLRVFWYLAEGQISSKEEAGRWGARALPESDLRATVAAALAVYSGEQPAAEMTPESLGRFARYIDAEVERLLVNRHVHPAHTAAAATAPEPVLECLRCQVPLEFGGIRPLREGLPVAPGTRMAFSTEALRMYYCPSCGKVEFFLPPVVVESVECLSCGEMIPSDQDKCHHCGWTWK